MTNGRARNNRHARAARRHRQALDVLGWIERGTALVDEQAVIQVAAKLGALCVPRHDLDAMREDACEQRLLVAKRLEVRRFPRGLKMP